MNYFSQTLTISGQVTNVDVEKQNFSLKTRSGDTFVALVGPTTWYQVVSNLDNLDRDRVAEPVNGPTGNSVRYGLQKYVAVNRPVTVSGILQEHEGQKRFDAKVVMLLHSDPTSYVFEETHWWITQVSQMSDRILDDLFDARRNYTIDDFSRLYRTQLNILGQPTGDTIQESAVMSRLIYDLSSSYLLTGSERYLLAARAAVDYLREAFRSLSHDGEHCFWAYGRRRLQEGQKGENLLVASQGPDDVGSIPLYEQIYALAGLTQFYRVTNDWEVLEDIRRTMNSFQAFFHDPPEAKAKSFAGEGGYYSHIDPVTMRPDSPSLGQNRSQKNWNSVGDHIPAYLVNLILSLDPLPTGEPRARQVLASVRDTALQILEETSSLIVEKFPAKESDYVDERFHADWKPMHDYGWQQNRAVVGHNLKIAWNLTRVAFYFQMRASRLEADGDHQEAARCRQRATSALERAEDIAERMGRVGLDQLRGGVYDCVEREPADGMPTQFVWGNTKDFWQQEQGILAYLILYGAKFRPQHLALARECSAFWNTFFLDRERQSYFFRVTENGLPILQGEYGRKGGHAIGYHACELGYLAHIYTRTFVTGSPGASGFSLYFKVTPRTEETSINVLPDFMPPGKLRIAKITANGVDVTPDKKPANPNDFQISLEDLGRDHLPIELVVEFRVLASSSS